LNVEVFELICFFHLLYYLLVSLKKLSVTQVKHFNKFCCLCILKDHLFLKKLLHHYKILCWKLNCWINFRFFRHLDRRWFQGWIYRRDTWTYSKMNMLGGLLNWILLTYFSMRLLNLQPWLWLFFFSLPVWEIKLNNLYLFSRQLVIFRHNYLLSTQYVIQILRVQVKITIFN